MSKAAAEKPLKRPSIRQAYADQTKAAILDAARHLFAAKGYTEAGVRDIAETANVNPALIARYFGSKLALFDAALAASLEVEFFTRIAKEDFGAVVAASFCHAGEDEALAVPALILAAGDSAAREVAVRLLKQLIEAPLIQWFDTADAEDRAAQLIAVTTGFFTYRLMLPLKAMQAQVSPDMQRWLSHTLQEIIDRPGTNR